MECIILGIITRECAQFQCDIIVRTQHANGNEAAHQGLMIGTMINVIRVYKPTFPMNLSTPYIDASAQDGETIQTQLNALIPTFEQLEIQHERQRALSGQDNCCIYLIMKYIADAGTGRGHTVLISIVREEAQWRVNVFDPQLNRLFGFNGIGQYLATTHWVGVTILCQQLIGGKRKTRKRNGGMKELKDPEMWPMNDTDKELQGTLIETISKELYYKPLIIKSLS